MFPHISPDKNGLPLENGIQHRVVPGPGRVLVGIGQVNDENQQNLRIQQAVNRYNGTVNIPPYWRPSAAFKCSLFKAKSLKPSTSTSEHGSPSSSRSKPENRYASAGHFPTVFLGRSMARPAKKQSIISQLRINSPGLPVSRFMDDSAGKYSEVKSTRSVLDVLQDLSRKRIHGKDEGDDATKRRCKGLGGDLVQEGIIPYNPLFVPKPKLHLYPKKDQTTQTLENLSLNGSSEAGPAKQDPKWEIRKKLAQKNNEIFASLSSSINGALFTKRKRVPEATNWPQKEDQNSKNKKIKEAEHPMENLETPTSRREKRGRDSNGSNGQRTPPTKDRLMSIYWDLQSAGDVKRNVLQTLQTSPVDKQFERSTPEPKEEKRVTFAPLPNSENKTANIPGVTPLSSVSSPKTSEMVAPVLTSPTPSTPSLKLPTPTSSPFSFGLNKPSSSPAATVTSGFNFSPGDSKVSPVPKKDSAKDSASEPSGFAGKSLAELNTFGKFAAQNKESVLASPIINKDSGLKSSPALANVSPSTPTGVPTSVVPSFGIPKAEPPSFGQTKVVPTVASSTQPSIAFGQSKTGTVVSTPSTFTFGQTIPVSPVVTGQTAVSTPPAFTFGQSKPEPTTVTKPFAFGQSKTETAAPTPSTFTFGQNKPESAVVTGQTKSELPTVSTPPAVTFGHLKPESTSVTKPFTFGQSKTETAVSTPSTFTFGQSKPESPAVASQANSESSMVSAPPAFSFGQSKQDTTPSTLNFGQNKPASDSAPKVTTSGFSFGQQKTDLPPTSTSTTSSFSFGGLKPNSSAPGFSFNLLKKESSADPETYGILAPTNDTFRFGQAKSDTTVTSTVTFGNLKSSETDKTSAAAVSSSAPSEKKSIFAFGMKQADSKPISSAGDSVKVSDSPKWSFAATPATTESGKTGVGGPSIFGSGKTTSATPSSIFARLGKSESASSGGILETSVSSSTPSPAPTDSPKPRTVTFGEVTTEKEESGPAKGGIFATTASAGSLFSGTSDGKPTATTAASMFGQTTAGGSLFAQAPSTVTSSTFGQSGEKTGFSFGATTTAAATPAFGQGGTFSFGQTSASTVAPTQTTPSFGTSQEAGGFGQPKTQASTLASSGTTFGQPQTTSSGFSFGATTKTTGSGFAFGKPADSPKTFAFGAAQSNAQQDATKTASPFSAVAPTTGAVTSGFGSIASSAGFGAGTNSTPAFGSSAPAFGSSSTSGFGTPTTTQSGFGATTNSTPAFGNATAAFGTAAPSPAFGANTTPSFGSSATPAFGVTTTAPPAFGGSTTPAFGTASGAFGNASTTPAFGNATTTSAFGSSTTAPAFGSSTTAPAFGSSTTAPAFGSSTTAPVFGSSTTAPAFGSSTTTPAFGNAVNPPTFGNATTTPAFGSSTTPAFGSAAATPAFGSATTTPGFGSSTTTPAFGGSGSASGFGTAPATPAFGSATAPPAFGASNPPAFGSTTTPAFGSTSTPSTAGSAPFTFGANQPPAFNFGASTAPPNQTAAPFNFGSGSSSNTSGSSVFNFGGNSGSTSGGAFTFGSNSSGFSQTPTPGASGFATPFGQTPSPGGFSLPGTFSIGSGSSQPRSRTSSRLRRRP